VIRHDVLLDVWVGLPIVGDDDEGCWVGGPDEVCNDIPHGRGGILIPGVNFPEGIDDDRHGLEGGDEGLEVLRMHRLEDVEGARTHGVLIGELDEVVVETEAVGLEFDEAIRPGGARGIELEVEDSPRIANLESHPITVFTGEGGSELDGGCRIMCGEAIPPGKKEMIGSINHDAFHGDGWHAIDGGDAVIAFLIDDETCGLARKAEWHEIRTNSDDIAQSHIASVEGGALGTERDFRSEADGQFVGVFSQLPVGVVEDGDMAFLAAIRVEESGEEGLTILNWCTEICGRNVFIAKHIQGFEEYREASNPPTWMGHTIGIVGTLCNGPSPSTPGLDNLRIGGGDGIGTRRAIAKPGSEEVGIDGEAVGERWKGEGLR